ncbi:MAG: hypothetical protein ACR2JO_07330 [Mycobacteriales bacterium]
MRPPTGAVPPASAHLDEGEPLDLVALASEVCRRYRQEFPDEQGRYGEASIAWCVHDHQYVLYWAVEAADGYLDMHREVAWLARVLEARDFPLSRLARSLDIGADVVLGQVGGVAGRRLSDVLVNAAAFVRSRDTFLDGTR